MFEFFVISIVGVLLGMSMMWMSSQQRAERLAHENLEQMQKQIEVLMHQNEILRNQAEQQTPRAGEYVVSSED